MNLLVADHHPIYQLGIKKLLEHEESLNIVGKVNDGKKLKAGLEEYKPDILILEIDLPNVNGLNCLREIKECFPDVKVLVMSCHPEEVYALSCVKAGAYGYVEKTSGRQSVLNAIRMVSKGHIYLSDHIRSLSSPEELDNNVQKFKKLSFREIEVLNLLAKGNRNKEIAQSLDINEKTVSTYKTRLLKKLNVDNIAELINHSRLMEEVQIEEEKIPTSIIN